MGGAIPELASGPDTGPGERLQMNESASKSLELLASPRRFERPTNALGKRCSIQLSYGDLPRLSPSLPETSSQPERFSCEVPQSRGSEGRRTSLFESFSTWPPAW